MYVVTNVCVCSGSDGRHAGGDLREGEGGDHGGERARRVGAASRAAVSPPPPTSASVPRPPSHRCGSHVLYKSRDPAISSSDPRHPAMLYVR